MVDRGSFLGFDANIGPATGGIVDLSPGGASGATLVRNGMIARCMADTWPRIGAVGDCIPAGVDVRAWVGEATDDNTADERAQLLTMVFARDLRVDANSIDVKVKATRAGSIYSFTISVDARTVSGGPIALVMGVNSANVDILAQGAVS